jgi:hypothetical protein
MVEIVASGSYRLRLGENDGFKENEIQSTYSALIFISYWSILYDKNRKNMTGEHPQRM